ncbi:uncharacterized protein EI90DRAFT_957216 [Cantharellus anzutake]|uniref:uncharacterized protein n=1 Tax=Cantharellus anzutake TaxID=1750568 RepID=UPI0019077C7E|nr:uncharacterized protein EI90DRAFT_957216 [Cantharellus anzutake]KAF8331663.1 hypothetical protein EI90DRAFT_957216 [Cantharellus anzutake]
MTALRIPISGAFAILKLLYGWSSAIQQCTIASISRLPLQCSLGIQASASQHLLTASSLITQELRKCCSHSLLLGSSSGFRPFTLHAIHFCPLAFLGLIPPGASPLWALLPSQPAAPGRCGERKAQNLRVC